MATEKDESPPSGVPAVSKSGTNLLVVVVARRRAHLRPNVPVVGAATVGNIRGLVAKTDVVENRIGIRIGIGQVKLLA